MNKSSPEYTILELCEQMKRSDIVVNRTYQRSNKVWPPSARSYLIDSILSNYPISNILLRQTFDLKSKKISKEIIDGQQRSQAILDYYGDVYPISLRDSEFHGKKFSDLDEVLGQKFVNYVLAIDIFTAATDSEIREVFRRMNAYAVPANKQELRHATYQGPFKFFVLRLSEKYADALKRMGVFSERQINRMNDAELLTHVLAAVANGIETSDPKKLNGLYEKYDEKFEMEEQYQAFIDWAFTDCLELENLIRDSRLSSPHMFYSLLLALGNARIPVQNLLKDLDSQSSVPVDSSPSAHRLSMIVGALEEWEERRKEGGPGSVKPEGHFAPLLAASTAGTNVKSARVTRFQWISNYLR